MSAPRGLSPEEAALWARLAKTVKPLHRSPSTKVNTKSSPPQGGGAGGGGPAIREGSTPPPSLPLKGEGRLAKQPPKASELSGKSGDRKSREPSSPSSVRPKDNQTGLDSHWERRLARDTTQPDFTLDLHGHTLDSGMAPAR